MTALQTSFRGFDLAVLVIGICAVSTAALLIREAGAPAMVSAAAGSGTDTLIGDLYAVLGAVFASGYILAGRRLLAGGIAWQPYVTRLYTIAAVLLVAAALLTGESFAGHSTRTYAIFAAL